MWGKVEDSLETGPVVVYLACLLIFKTSKNLLHPSGGDFLGSNSEGCFQSSFVAVVVGSFTGSRGASDTLENTVFAVRGVVAGLNVSGKSFPNLNLMASKEERG